MKTFTICALAVFSAAFALSAPAPKNRLSMKDMTPEQRKAEIERRTGGKVAVPNSQKGEILFFNVKNAIARSDLDKTLSVLAKANEYRFVVKDVAESGDPIALARAAKSPLAVVVVSDDATSPMLVAPDEGWAVVNTKRLAEGLSSEEAKTKFFAARCRKQIIRAFVLAATGTGSQYTKNFFAVKSIPELDQYNEFVPNDSAKHCRDFLEAKGVTPLQYAFYVKACSEGWAPQPTNEAQKVIWQRFHEVPSKGIDIKYDPKKGE